MTRQINLLRDDLLPGYGKMQLPVFVGAVLISLLLAGAWVGLSLLARQGLLSEQQQWQAEAVSSLERLKQFRQRYPALTNASQLSSINLQLAGQLQTARETYSGLTNQVENAIEGFHTPLIHLAEQDIDGLWLNAIALKDGQRFFSLDGFVRNPELIPQYLDRLGRSSFGGIGIDQLALAKSPGRSNLWRFTLSNHRERVSVERP
jgi:hypothetical protein